MSGNHSARLLARKLLVLMTMVWLLGCTADYPLLVSLQTDFVPGVEFTEVTVERVDASTGSLDERRHPVGVADVFIEPARIAELGGLASGAHSLLVTLLDGDQVVVERRVELELDGPAAVTAVIARVCRDVRCGPTETCVAGRCVDPGCTPETPERCPPPQCEEGESCVAAASCTTAVCSNDVCLQRPNGVCETNEWCDPSSGCRPLAGAPDAGPPDAGPPDSGCAEATAELCNGIDDDCDGEVDEGLTRVSSPAACGGLPLEGLATIAGVTWDRGASVRDAVTSVGAPYTPTCCAAPDFGSTEPLLDLTRTLGILLGAVETGGLARWGRFPGTGEMPGANVDRRAFDLTWGEGQALHNGPGPDLAVYESATNEPFTVQLRVGDTWSPRRYAFAGELESANGVNATVFDLSDFGLLEGQTASAVRLENVFSPEAAVGGDRVREVGGAGEVVRPGEPGYDEAFPLLDSAGGAAFPVTELDTDLLWVVSLHPVSPASCCIR